LLGGEAADRRNVGMALRRMRTAPALRRSIWPARIWQSRAGMAAAAVVLLLTGIFTERLVRPDGATPRPPDKLSAATGRPAAPAGQERTGTGSPWLDRLAAAEAGDMAAVFSEVIALPPDMERDQIMGWTLLRWADLDPAAARAALDRSFPGDSALQGKLFAAWARLDSAAAWQATEAIPDDAVRRAAKQSVMAWLAGAEPARFAELAAAGHPAGAADWARAISAMADNGTPPARTSALLATLAPQTRRAALTSAVDAMASRDPFRAFDWSKSLSDAGDRNLAVTRSLTAMALVNADRAGRELAALDDPLTPARAIVSVLGRENPTAALAWAGRHASEHLPALTRELLLGLVRTADNRALDLIAQLSRDGGAAVFRQDQRLDDIFWQARGLDFARALTWQAQEAPKKAFGWDNIQKGLLFSWAKEDRAAAADWIDTHLTNPAAREQARSTIAFEILSTTGDTRKAWDYNLSRDAGPERGRVAVEVIRRQAAIDPSAAAGLLTGIPAEADRGKAIESVASAWGTAAPREAVEWAGGLSGQDEKVRAFGAIARQWAEYDSYEASQWMNNLPRGPERDAAAHALVEGIAPYEGDSAFTWAGTIADEALRRKALTAAVQAWAQQDAAAAAAGVRDSTLSSADRRHAEQALQLPPPGNAAPQPK